MALDNMWSELALVTITKKVSGSGSSTGVLFRTLTETINIDIGEKNFDVIATVAGGRLTAFTPQEPTEITLELYPVEAGTDSGTVGRGVMDLLFSADTSQPLAITPDLTRQKIRMTFMWTDDTSLTDAEAALSASTKTAYRLSFAEGYVIAAAHEFTDGRLKVTLRAKFPPFDKNGATSAGKNWKFESTVSGSTALSALADYNDSQKF